MAVGGDADQTVDPVGVPTLSLVLGFGPMLPILAAGLAALLWGDPLRAVAIVGGTGWAAAILLFIAGLLALPVFLLSPVAGILLLMLGYAGVAVLDPLAARRGEAPRHFARLRPPQMAVGLLGLGLLAAACLRIG
ncbi:DUF3429 domain-containing protein [Sphingomonas montanisoli]|uniref:DUF3429 domain-containing protein n=1 Tax=Sphingomonas montanisoli TaxID=2606412 RepID=A0A5D9C6W2_9SPHN|nr:DUF3429 domain-containing protein [Sphingomonas montanisoli]TZG25761.1 DUF3429 domain-containing protein [Sphingomonas montanisoli]